MRDRPEPLYSTREDSAELEEAINAFVITLAERIDVLQDVHSVVNPTATPANNPPIAIRITFTVVSETPNA